ncbi:MULTISPECIES: fructose bisphosphate aldolase [unclassified Ruegeria]|uniref:fructose bisphosphate aldolase n=1 Tax=unclassified Ruegeria TaxID=2625375 RepID=UPI0014914572|nr:MULTISPECIES: fructose bisphosphate aldolase [unclassified Ruegeria]NOD46155.1 fructose bisphosphate aldolase [Ruegeria sp. HKCCD5849]NOD50545.1 fructose bisphosphate aldolase [Ruegeria sp. HKCCD5851]NOD67361.1 fructose bisphosphate aldolase [Ruegeria sp. HKCCD7303]NOE32947.1 fructose bisphosphate aldolase [Ruegeria sp. HKCCD7318]
MSKAEQRAQMSNGAGFIAALDQSGGSTPKALALYGVDASAYASEEEMFGEIQNMRARIILADDFTKDKVIGAILFERTLGEEIDGRKVADYLWSVKGIVPFLKIDKGLEETANGVQMMKPIPGLAETLAKAEGVFGTKERSVIHEANAEGIAAVVAQQFDVAREVVAAGMVPIVEPEVNINSETKAEAEEILKAEILNNLDQLTEGQDVMLKLTIPSTANLYDEVADHPRVVRVVALSGGYSTEQACDLLGQNGKMIASFSRALTEGLSKQQSDAEFNTALGSNIDKIFKASA